MSNVILQENCKLEDNARRSVRGPPTRLSADLVRVAGTYSADSSRIAQVCLANLLAVEVFRQNRVFNYDLTLAVQSLENTYIRRPHFYLLPNVFINILQLVKTSAPYIFLCTFQELLTFIITC